MEKEMRNKYFSSKINDLKDNYDFVMDGVIAQNPTPENEGSVSNRMIKSEKQLIIKCLQISIIRFETLPERGNNGNGKR